MKNAAQNTHLEDLMPLPRPVSVIVVIIAIAFFLPAAAMHAAQTASCTFNTFSAPKGYSLSAVNGVTDDGTVVGQLTDNSTLALVAFTYSASTGFTEYSAPKSLGTWMYGANTSGVNAGYYQDSTFPEAMHGYLLQGGKYGVVNYPSAANTWLFDVNQLGAAVGSFSASQSVTKGFMLVNGKYTAIAYPNAQLTYAQAINDNGEVAGSYSSGFVSYGFLWQSGTFTNVDYPKARFGTALVGVNDSGVVAGNRFVGDKALGFIYEDGVFKNIVYTGAKYTMAGGINNNGLVSGQIVYSGTDSLGYTADCK
jgi:hypothetical protein